MYEIFIKTKILYKKLRRPVISYKSHQEDYERMEKIIKMQQKQKIFKTKNMTLVRIDTPKG